MDVVKNHFGGKMVSIFDFCYHFGCDVPVIPNSDKR